MAPIAPTTAPSQTAPAPANSDWGPEPGPAPAPNPTPAPDPEVTPEQGIAGFEAARTALRALHDAGRVTADNGSVLTDAVSTFDTGVAAVKALGSAPDQALVALDKDLANLNSMKASFASSGALEITADLDKQLSVAHADAERAIKLLQGA